MKFNKLVSASLKDQFVKEMAGKILSGELQPGDRLPTERELTEQLGVSRSVINGGINELARCGFLEIQPRKGVLVADFRRQGTMEALSYVLEYNQYQFQPDLLASLYEVRANIEGHIVSLCAKHCTDQDIAMLLEQIDTIEASRTPEEFGERIHSFYHLLAVASKNIIYPLNIQAYKSIYVSLTAALADRIPATLRGAKLRQLVTCIQNGDETAARQCVDEIAKWGMETLVAEHEVGEYY